jgi:surface antigen
MARRFSIALKMVTRLTGINAMSGAQLARETGIRLQKLSRWLNEARNRTFGASSSGIDPAWAVAQKDWIEFDLA